MGKMVWCLLFFLVAKEPSWLQFCASKYYRSVALAFHSVFDALGLGIHWTKGFCSDAVPQIVGRLQMRGTGRPPSDHWENRPTLCPSRFFAPVSTTTSAKHMDKNTTRQTMMCERRSVTARGTGDTMDGVLGVADFNSLSDG